MSIAAYSPKDKTIYFSNDFNIHLIHVGTQPMFICMEDGMGPEDYEVLEGTLKNTSLDAFSAPEALAFRAFLVDPFTKNVYVVQPQGHDTKLQKLAPITETSVIGSNSYNGLSLMNDREHHACLAVEFIVGVENNVTKRSRAFRFCVTTSRFITPNESYQYVPCVGEFEPCTCISDHGALHCITCPCSLYMPIDWKYGMESLLSNTQTYKGHKEVYGLYPKSDWGIDEQRLHLKQIDDSTHMKAKIESYTHSLRSITLQGLFPKTYLPGTILRLDFESKHSRDAMVLHSSLSSLSLTTAGGECFSSGDWVSIREYSPWGE